MSGLDGSGAVHTVLPWEAFGGHVPSGGSEMYWFDQSIPIHLFSKDTCLRHARVLGLERSLKDLEEINLKDHPSDARHEPAAVEGWTPSK